MPEEKRWFRHPPRFQPGSFLIVGALWEQVDCLVIYGHLRVFIWDSTFGVIHGLLLTSFHVVDEFGKGRVVGYAFVERENAAILLEALRILQAAANQRVQHLLQTSMLFKPAVFMSDQSGGLLNAARCV